MSRPLEAANKTAASRRRPAWVSESVRPPDPSWSAWGPQPACCSLPPCHTGRETPVWSRRGLGRTTRPSGSPPPSPYLQSKLLTALSHRAGGGWCVFRYLVVVTTPGYVPEQRAPNACGHEQAMSHLLLQAGPLTSYLAACSYGPHLAPPSWPWTQPRPGRLPPASPTTLSPRQTALPGPGVAGSPAPRKLSPLVRQVTTGPHLSHRTAPRPRGSFWGRTRPRGKGSGEALLPKILAPRGMLGRQVQTQACTPPPKPTLSYVTQAAWKGHSSGVAPRKLAEMSGPGAPLPSCFLVLLSESRGASMLPTQVTASLPR